jgi:FkbH-like protein
MKEKNSRLDRLAFEQVLANTDVSNIATEVKTLLTHFLERRDVDWLWNQLKKRSEDIHFEPFKMLVLSSFTLNLLEAPLGLQLASHQRFLISEFAPYQQWEMLLHHPETIVEKKVDVVQIFLHLEDVLPALSNNSILDEDFIVEQSTLFFERLKKAISAFRAQSQTPIVLNSFIAMLRGIERFASNNFNNSKYSAIESLNSQIAALSEECNNLYIYDYANLVSDIGRNNWFDVANYYHTLSPISLTGMKFLAEDLSKFYRALFQPREKVLVLDLDNTLWGGIIGEDGPNGIKIRDGHLGESFKAFQSTIKGLQETGIILAIASKNNEEDVKEVFNIYPDMPLKWADFIVTRINWLDKSANIVDIASTLNVGLDSIVFVDDNPLECERVRTALPEVTVVHLGNEPHSFIDQLLDAANLFPLKITHEDKIRSDSYRSESKRNESKCSTIDENEFLSSLELVIEIGPPEPNEYDRVVQLINKTNQFNLTTKRYQLDDVTEVLSSPDAELSVVRARDKFGDYGLIGVQILRFSKADCIIDTFLMSCRILGRSIEDSMLFFAKNVAKRRNSKKLIGQFIPTKKNMLVVDFYITSGFSPTSISTDFEYDLLANQLGSYPSYLTVREMEHQNEL